MTLPLRGPGADWQLRREDVYCLSLGLLLGRNLVASVVPPRRSPYSWDLWDAAVDELYLLLVQGFLL